MKAISKVTMTLGALLLLTSCGGKDYSSNKYIGESTTYYQLLNTQNYFTFKKDGTGKLKLDTYTYDLKFDLTSETSVSMEWGGAKMGTGTFKTDTNGKRTFTWSGKQYLAY